MIKKSKIDEFFGVKVFKSQNLLRPTAHLLLVIIRRIFQK